MTDTMITPEAATTPRRAGRREWVGLSVLALACLLYVMDLSVLRVAGMQLTSGVAALIALGLAVLSVVMLRGVEMGAEGEADGDEQRSQPPDGEQLRREALGRPAPVAEA